MHAYIYIYHNFITLHFFPSNDDANLDDALSTCSAAPSLLIVAKENRVQQVFLVAEGTVILEIPIVNLCSIFRILLASYYVFHRAYSNDFLLFLQEFMLGDSTNIKRKSKYMVFLNQYKL